MSCLTEIIILVSTFYCTFSGLHMWTGLYFITHILILNNKIDSGTFIFNQLPFKIKLT